MRRSIDTWRALSPRAKLSGLSLLSALLLPLPGASSRLRADVIITEINYSPRDPADSSVARDDLEFVELFNDGPEAYDVSGYVFTRGITFKIPDGTFIAGRGYLVVGRDAAALSAAYGISNVIGNFSGVLDDAGEAVELANPQGLPVIRVRYNDRGQWPSGAKGTGHTLSLRYEYVDPEDADNWTLSERFGGTPGRSNFNTTASVEDRTIVADNEVWRYFKGTEAPPADWNQLAFDDSGWLSGPTGIGYGDGDDRTTLDDMRGNYLSVFCRKVFPVDDPAAIDNLVLKVTYDDGFAAYLNGMEVGSRKLTGRAFDDPADLGPEPTLVELDISAFRDRLSAGDNLLAVQVHNHGLTSSDLSFIPQLVSRRVILPQETATVPVLVNEGLFITSGDRFVELYNKSATPVDLAGYWISDDFGNLQKFQIPAGTSIPARGYLSFTEAELGLDLSVTPGVRDRVPVALTNPAGSRVVDARLFEPLAGGVSEARIPDGDESFSSAAVPTPGAANRVDVVTDVIFNELMYNPITGDERDEFIEFYNRGDAARDISGWHVDGVGYDFPPDTVIAPDHYLVIAKDPARIRANYGLGPAVVLDNPYLGRLSNAGERLRLVDLAGNIADQVRYADGGEWTRWADGLGSSLERIDPLAEGSVASTWDASDDSAKVSSESFFYTATHGGGESDFGILLMDEGIAIIDDLDLRRTSGGSNLISNSTFESNTLGWRIEGTHIRSGRTTTPGEVLSGAGSLKLISWNGTGDYKVNRVETNTGNQSSGRQYRISYRARWVVGSPTILTIGDYNIGNPSSSGLAGASQFVLPKNLGTPGAVNSATSRRIAADGDANLGPAIDRVKHSPGVPEGNEPVTVKARVRDFDGVASVRVFYRFDTPVGSFSPVTMTDPDGDGRYEATIPGQALGTRVLFYIEAVDGRGRLSRFPRDIFEMTHPPVVDPSRAAADEALYCIYRHDQRVPSTRYHSFRFVMDEARESELGSRRVLSNFSLEGTLVFGTGDVYYNAHLRFAGSPWLRPSGSTFAKSYSVEMPKDDPLWGRVRAFNLDEHGSDGRERVAHYLLRQNAGSTRLPYFDRGALARFSLNDVHSANYEAIQKPNRQYMQFWFPEDVNPAHYEMDDRFGFNDSGGKTGNAEGHVLAPPYGSKAGGSNKENYRWFFALRNRKGWDDFNPLLTVCRIMDPGVTPNSFFDSVIFSTFDVEEILKVWAIELNIDDWDTWAGRRGKNCYLYQSDTDGLWRKVPWDLELTFGDTNAFGMPSSPASTYSNHFGEITRMLNRPRIKRMYYGILKEQVDRFFNGDASSPLRDFSANLAGSGVGLGGTMGFITTRGNKIRSWIRSAVSPQIPLTITTNGGRDLRVQAARVTLAGNAPADIFSFGVSRNGAFLDDPAPPFTFSTSNLQGWSAGIPLLAGRNDLEIIGFDSRGQPVDSVAIVVTAAPPWGAPSISTVAPDPVPLGQSITLEGTEFHEGLTVVFSGAFEVTDIDFDEALDPGTLRVVVPRDLVGGVATVEVRNRDGQVSNAVVLGLLPPGAVFIRGDANLDGGLDISDPVSILSYLFSGGRADCLDAADTNDDATVDLTDAIVGLSFLFKGGAPPPAPFPAPGPDPTDDAMGCDTGL